jgi:glycosyltransferase involved in cell wall biosynthesis
MVSPSSHEEFQDFDRKKEVLITNGFDDEDFEKIENVTAQKFSIFHSGLLNFIRNPENLWQVLEKLCRENQDFKDDFELKLIGAVDPMIIQAISKYPFLKEKVEEHGWMQHDEIIRRTIKQLSLCW